MLAAVSRGDPQPGLVDRRTRQADGLRNVSVGIGDVNRHRRQPLGVRRFFGLDVYGRLLAGRGETVFAEHEGADGSRLDAPDLRVFPARQISSGADRLSGGVRLLESTGRKISGPLPRSGDHPALVFSGETLHQVYPSARDSEHTGGRTQPVGRDLSGVDARQDSVRTDSQVALCATPSGGSFRRSAQRQVRHLLFADTGTGVRSCELTPPAVVGATAVVCVSASGAAPRLGTAVEYRTTVWL